MQKNMKTVLVALNSKYIHSCLAVWYLKKCCGSSETKVLEFNVNDETSRILSAVYREKPDVVAFSCYIWNITRILGLVADIKKIHPGTAVVLGGPEVSYDVKEIMTGNEGIDFIVKGEGEAVFGSLLDAIAAGSGFEQINGIAWRDVDDIKENPGYNIVEDLRSLPFPYDREFLSSVRNRIAYYEASRGCPFNCSYCLSSTFHGVRYIPLERVERELAALVEAGVRQVKFVDRTFNCNRDRADSILSYIIDTFGDSGVNFHFEITGELLDESTLALLSKSPHGLIQFEIGVQSTNPISLERVNRTMDFPLLSRNVRGLRENGNIHIHLDLIAGLPGETLATFAKSFNDVYALKPHNLQLGFLKMLKGTEAKRNSDKYGYGYRAYPPYEVLFSRSMSFDDIAVLKDTEEVLDRYYNSGRFTVALEYLTGRYRGGAYEFYRNLAIYNNEKGFLHRPTDDRKLYTLLLEFTEEAFERIDADVITELLRFDYLSCHRRGKLPEGIEKKPRPLFREKCIELLKDTGFLQDYMPQYAGLSLKNILKWVGFEEFKLDVAGCREENTVVFFDYGRKDPVTKKYKCQKLKKYL